MNTIEAIILGVVQGLTEFLPVSSSGHLVMAQSLLGVEPEGGIVFEVAVHVATLVAILLFYFKRVSSLTVGAVTGDGDAWRYIGKLAVATLPAIGIALTLRGFIEEQFGTVSRRTHLDAGADHRLRASVCDIARHHPQRHNPGNGHGARNGAACGGRVFVLDGCHCDGGGGGAAAARDQLSLSGTHV